MKKIISVLAVLISTTFALAGKEGGGGAAVVCQTSSGVTAELLDLYSFDPNQSRIVRTNDPVETQIQEALKRLNFFDRYEVVEIIKKMKFDMLPPNIRMSKVSDLGKNPVFMRDNCSPEWVAFYGADDSVKIVSKYFNLMSPTDQAALYVHEGIYELARTTAGDTDSSRTRALVNELFSKQPNEETIEKLFAPLRYRSGNKILVDKEELNIEVQVTRKRDNVQFSIDDKNAVMASLLCDGKAIKTSSNFSTTPDTKKTTQVKAVYQVKASILDCRELNVSVLAASGADIQRALYSNSRPYPYERSEFIHVVIKTNGKVLRDAPWNNAWSSTYRFYLSP
ncbi:MAG: hypothetical protein AB7F59_09245 [Bdellovibrionales bacterium]